MGRGTSALPSRGGSAQDSEGVLVAPLRPRLLLKTVGVVQVLGRQGIRRGLNQGDKELELGLPVLPLHNRQEVNVAHASMSIIEFCICPLAFASLRLFPQFLPVRELLMDNLSNWTAQWWETNPDTTDLERTTARLKQLKERAKEVGKPEK